MRRMVTSEELGTKLYKHTIVFDIGFSGEEEEVRAELITPSGESLAGKEPSVELISGTLAYNYADHPILFINEYNIVFYDTSNLAITMGDIGGDGKIESDTVEVL